MFVIAGYVITKAVIFNCCMGLAAIAIGVAIVALPNPTRGVK